MNPNTLLRSSKVGKKVIMIDTKDRKGYFEYE